MTQLKKAHLFGSELYIAMYASPQILLRDVIDIENSLKLVPSSEKYLVLQLDTPGGNPEMAKEIVEMFRNRACEIEEGCTLITYVNSTSKCSSACHIIFSGGHIKIVGRKSIFGFHAERNIEREIVPGSIEQRLIESGFRKDWIIDLSKRVFLAKLTLLTFQELN